MQVQLTKLMFHNMPEVRLTVFLPLFKEVRHMPEVRLTVFSLHVHQDTIRSRLDWYMEK